jgi:hypothetical protein
MRILWRYLLAFIEITSQKPASAVVGIAQPRLKLIFQDFTRGVAWQFGQKRDFPRNFEISHLITRPSDQLRLIEIGGDYKGSAIALTATSLTLSWVSKIRSTSAG